MFQREYSIIFEGIDIDPIINLRMQFQVDKSDGETLNRGIITIFNLNPSSRAALTHSVHPSTIFIEPIIKVHLFVGYDGNIKEVIAGDIYISHSQRVGTDWVTKIELYSGIAAATNGITTVSYDGTTNAKYIADQLTVPMGISINYTKEALDLLTQYTYEDFSVSATSMRSITQFLKRKEFNMAFTIEEDNKGLVYIDDAPRELNQPRTNANAFNKFNGLIGSPNITRTGVEFLSLIRSEIQLLQSVYVESQTINETLQKDELLTNKYYVKSIRHFGDTHDDEWFTEIQGFYSDLAEGSYAA